MEDLNKKAIKAVKKYLQKKEYEILDNEFEYPKYPVDLIAMDNGTLVFVQVKIKDKVDPTAVKHMNDKERDKFTRMAIKYLDEHSEINDCTVRLDKITLYMIKEDKVLIEHYINASSDRQ